MTTKRYTIHANPRRPEGPQADATVAAMSHGHAVARWASVTDVARPLVVDVSTDYGRRRRFELIPEAP